MNKDNNENPAEKGGENEENPEVGKTGDMQDLEVNRNALNKIIDAPFHEIIPNTTLTNVRNVKLTKEQLKKAAQIAMAIYGIATNSIGFFGDQWFTPDQMLAQYNFALGEKYGVITIEELMIIFEASTSAYAIRCTDSTRKKIEKLSATYGLI